MIVLAVILYVVFAFCLIAAVLAPNTKRLAGKGWLLMIVAVVAFAGFVGAL